MPDGPGNQVGWLPRTPADPFEVSGPEARDQFQVERPDRRISPGPVNRLEEQMREEETQVEGRVAGVGALEVQQDQAVGVDQDVLRAEVAEDERPLFPWP